jgi:hypothetical protein
MTDIQIGGVVREALVEATTGDVRIGGVVREALIAGLGLSGRISSKSFANAAASIVLGAGALLAGAIGAESAARAGPFALSINLSAHAEATSRARAGLPRSTTLAGRITTAAEAHMAALTLTVLGGRSRSSSRASSSAVVAIIGAGQNAVSVNSG